MFLMFCKVTMQFFIEGTTLTDSLQSVTIRLTANPEIPISLVLVEVKRSDWMILLCYAYYSLQPARSTPHPCIQGEHVLAC